MLRGGAQRPEEIEVPLEGLPSLGFLGREDALSLIERIEAYPLDEIVRLRALERDEGVRRALDRLLESPGIA